MQDSDLDQIYRPPEADLTGPSAQPAEEREPLRGAGFWIRAVARLIDLAQSFPIGMVMGVFLFVLASALGYIDSPEQWEQRVGGSSVLGYLVGGLGIVVYHSFAELFGATTLGKLICGLRVIDERGRPPSFRGVVVRSFAYYIDSLFFGVIAYSQMKDTLRQQRYGDLWGKTMVVRSRDMPVAARRGALMILFGLAGGALLWGLTLSLPIVLAVFFA